MLSLLLISGVSVHLLLNGTGLEWVKIFVIHSFDVSEVLEHKVALLIGVEECENFRYVFARQVDPTLLKSLLEVSFSHFTFAPLVQESIDASV